MKKVFLSAIIAAGLLFSCEEETKILKVEVSTNSITTTSTIVASKKNVQNGDTINLTTNIKAVINDKPVLFTAVYLCDDKEIGSSRDSINNYRYDYVVKDLSIGSHKLTSKASYEEDGASSTITATTSINVIE